MVYNTLILPKFTEKLQLFYFPMVDLNLEQIPQKTFVEISILGGRFLVGFLEYKTDGSSTFQVPI